MVHPKSRDGKVLDDYISKAELDTALEVYRQASARASEEVCERLRGLARRLEVNIATNLHDRSQLLCKRGVPFQCVDAVAASMPFPGA